LVVLPTPEDALLDEAVLPDLPPQADTKENNADTNKVIPNFVSI